MTHKFFLWIVLVSFGSVSVSAGCSRGSRLDRPTTYPVSGTISLGGQPIEKATVSFVPMQGSQGAFGITDSDGRFSLSTFAGGDGALPGDYKVTVIKMESAGAPANASSTEYVPPDQVLPEPKNLLPKQYASAESSGLTATVAPTSENAFVFELKR